MKKLLFIALLTCMALHSAATNYIVYVTTTGFHPDTLRGIFPGDQITWWWINGTQTTTSTTIPAGVQKWSSVISEGNSSFTYTIPNVAGAYNYQSDYNPTGIVGIIYVQQALKVPTIANHSVSCSPNPAHGKLHLTFINPATTTSVTLCDVTGKSLLSSQHNAKEADLDVSTLPGGIYFLRTKDEDGTLSTQRVEIRN